MPHLENCLEKKLAVLGLAGDDPIAVAADAGSDQTVLFGSQVVLDGSNSTGPITSYSWAQLSGPQVNLIEQNTSTHPLVLLRLRPHLSFS